MALPEIKVRMTSDTRHAESGVERVTSDLNKMGSAAVRAGRSAVPLGRSMDDLARRSGNVTRGIQNAAFQVGDFAVQVGGGVQASKALAMQLPQLLGGFGVLGAVAGAAVAILIPMRTAMQGLASDGAALEGVFGTLTPTVEALSRSFALARDIGFQMAETIINNVDRILITAGVAAAFFAGKWVAGFIAARIATFSLSAALVALRGALIRTGFGAIIVGAGELVYQFTRLAEATGTFGEAMKLLRDVALESWGKIRAGAEGMVLSMQAAWANMEGSFLGAISRMAMKASDFFMSMSEGVGSIPGMEGLAGGLMSASDAFLRGAATTSQAGQLALNRGKGLSGQASDAFGDMSGPFESIQKIRDLLSGMKDDRITLPNILGVDDEEGDGGSSGGAKTLKEKLEGQEKVIADHMARIRALTEGGLRDKLGAWGDYFSNLATLTQSKNQKLLQVSKTFAASQALIDAWVAHNEVLADPKLPWYARIAAAAQVLAAGVGAVNAIKSVGEGGSGGTSGASAGASTASAASSTRSPNVALQLVGGDMYDRNQVIGLINAINEAQEDGAIIRLV